MVVMAEKLKHNVEEQEVHTVGASDSRRGLSDFSSWGCRCCHMVHWLMV